MPCFWWKVFYLTRRPTRLPFEKHQSWGSFLAVRSTSVVHFTTHQVQVALDAVKQVSDRNGPKSSRQSLSYGFVIHSWTDIVQLWNNWRRNPLKKTEWLQSTKKWQLNKTCPLLVTVRTLFPQRRVTGAVSTTGSLLPARGVEACLLVESRGKRGEDFRNATSGPLLVLDASITVFKVLKSQPLPSSLTWCFKHDLPKRCSQG